MKFAAGSLVVLALAACQSPPDQSQMERAGAGPDGAYDLPGREIAETLCASCHAIGRADESLHPEAPALRTLSTKYPVEMLAEALAEGILVGHPDMPPFVLEPGEIDALLDYLEVIQVTR